MIIESQINPSLMAEKMSVPDKPPPAYSPVPDGISGGSMSGSQQEQRRRHVPPPLAAPLPSAREQHARHDHHPMMRHRAMPLPSPTVDQIHIFDRKHNIEGTYYVDPQVPMLDPSKRQKEKSSEPFPNASFRTVHDNIDIHLATTGDARVHPKANIRVGTKDGLVKVTLLPFAPSRPRIGLNMFSRQGNVVLLLPTNFVGVIQLSTRKGVVDILPALTRRMKVVKSSGRDRIIMVGNANEDIDGVREVSFCELTSRTGNVIVGLDGQDQYVPPVGFWKKLTGALKGTH